MSKPFWTPESLDILERVILKKQTARQVQSELGLTQAVVYNALLRGRVKFFLMNASSDLIYRMLNDSVRRMNWFDYVHKYKDIYRPIVRDFYLRPEYVKESIKTVEIRRSAHALKTIHWRCSKCGKHFDLLPTALRCPECSP